jgi:hypothetical protein
MDDVFSQRIVLRLDSLVVFFQRMQLSDLFLKLLDIAFFSLTECTLQEEEGLCKPVLVVVVDDMRIDKAKRPSRKL